MGVLLAATSAAADSEVILGTASRAAVAKSQAARPLAADGAAIIDLGLPAAKSVQLPGESAPGNGPQQIGIERTVAAGAAANIRWLLSASGSMIGRVDVRSPGAAAMRVAIAVANTPAGARLHFGPADGLSIHSEGSAEAIEATRQRGVYWGPVTAGADQVVELELPPGTVPRSGMLSVRSVSHLIMNPAASAPPAGGAKSSGTCERDVSCSASVDDAVAKAARAVAKIVYTVDGMTYACTGTLVNSAGSAQVPYVLTAKHCISSAAAAATVNTYWFLEAISCGAKATTQPVQLTRGASLAYAGAVSDVALIRLNEPAPANAWFSGIDASVPAANDEAITLHHPQGDLKKVSIGRIVEPVNETGTSTSVGWLSGSTEPGSSGSGLFTRRGGELVLRGTLRGGSASCGNSGSIADSANRDLYARLDLDVQAMQTLMKAATEPTENYSDIWASETEGGTGLSITHRSASNAMFVVAFGYDGGGETMWLVIQGGGWQSPSRFSAPAYRASRNGAVVTQVPIGTATLSFEAGRVTVVTEIDGALARTNAYRRHVF